ncbi:NAD(P)-binding protein [Aspergillus ellipticus CBS 707.79]|uniref:Short-chain dehydrogenase/reductase 3 n=1 Tax=Aspergillus ellipticus CBS 707.79 TaxID=1448320 RepID=A0A319DQE6_9EURO|nr:NAD(P)-binding protein [Aspergillus ellipticus CBS 707.79]
MPPAVAIGLGVVSCISLLSRANAYLSKQALNNTPTGKPWSPEQEIVVITGGSGGIGVALVKLLASQGTKTIIFDVVEPPAGLTNPNTFFYNLDLTDSSAIKAIAARVRSEHGNPTILINNAGIESNLSILALPEPNLRSVFDVNIIAHFLLVQELLPAMISSNHGHIVTVASLASFTTHAINIDYACTKAAALAFHEGLGQELRHVYKANGVRNTIVHPGWVRTPIIQKMVDSDARKGQILEPRDVAEAIVNQIMAGAGGQLFLPSKYWFVSLVRGLPAWVQEGVRNKLSVTRIAVYGGKE